MKALKFVMTSVVFLLCGCGNVDTAETKAQSTIPTTAPQPALSPPPSRDIAGITLGGLLDLQPCKRSNRWDTAKSCWRYSDEEKIASGKPPTDAILNIVFSKDVVPTGLFNVADILLINGRVESIEFQTLGPVFQEDLYAMLVKKWGAAQTSNIQQLQNGFGASFSGIESSWRFADFGVLFLGVTTPDTGLIRIKTRVYEQKVREEQGEAATSL